MDPGHEFATYEDGAFASRGTRCPRRQLGCTLHAGVRMHRVSTIVNAKPEPRYRGLAGKRKRFGRLPRMIPNSVDRQAERDGNRRESEGAVGAESIVSARDATLSNSQGQPGVGRDKLYLFRARLEC